MAIRTAHLFRIYVPAPGDMFPGHSYHDYLYDFRYVTTSRWHIKDDCRGAMLNETDPWIMDADDHMTYPRVTLSIHRAGERLIRR